MMKHRLNQVEIELSFIQLWLSKMHVCWISTYVPSLPTIVLIIHYIIVNKFTPVSFKHMSCCVYIIRYDLILTHHSIKYKCCLKLNLKCMADFWIENQIINFQIFIGDTLSTRCLSHVRMNVLTVGIEQKIRVLESMPLIEIWVPIIQTEFQGCFNHVPLVTFLLCNFLCSTEYILSLPQMKVKWDFMLTIYIFFQFHIFCMQKLITNPNMMLKL